MNLFIGYIKLAVALRQFGLALTEENFQKVLKAADMSFEPIIYREVTLDWASWGTEETTNSLSRATIYLGLALIQMGLRPEASTYSKILSALDLEPVPEAYLRELTYQYLSEILERATISSNNSVNTVKPEERVQETVTTAPAKAKVETVVSAEDLFDF